MQNSVSDWMCLDNVKFNQYREHIHEHMLLQLKARFYGTPRKQFTDTVTVPASAWDHVKQELAPKRWFRLLSRWLKLKPVATRTVTLRVDAFVVYPQLPMQENNSRFAYFEMHKTGAL